MVSHILAPYYYYYTDLLISNHRVVSFTAQCAQTPLKGFICAPCFSVVFNVIPIIGDTFSSQFAIFLYIYIHKFGAAFDLKISVCLAGLFHKGIHEISVFIRKLYVGRETRIERYIAGKTCSSFLLVYFCPFYLFTFFNLRSCQTL